MTTKVVPASDLLCPSSEEVASHCAVVLALKAAQVEGNGGNDHNDAAAAAAFLESYYASVSVAAAWMHNRDREDAFVLPPHFVWELDESNWITDEDTWIQTDAEPALAHWHGIPLHFVKLGSGSGQLAWVPASSTYLWDLEEERPLSQ